MFLRKLLLLQIQVIFALQFIAADKAEVDVDELKAQISSHLSYTAHRLARIQKNVAPQYADELEQMLARYAKAANTEDPLAEEKLLLAYEGAQRQEFMGYLSLQYDEQFLNEDIRIQEWSMRQLLSQVSGPVAEEIEKLLPAYETAAKIEDFDKKYAAFTAIQEGFSSTLWKLLDAQPEDKALLNVQLQFFREFLMYLLKQQEAAQFVAKLKSVLGEVEAALVSADMKQKLDVLDSFDDLTTKFGRYLDYKVLEFEFDRFGRNSSTGKRYISKACIGVYKRYHICNEQPCPAALADFRAVQCAAFNEVDFQGQKYTWEPYIKEDAECELNCKPVGMKYFATLNSSVIDGTPCFRPAEYYRSNYRQRAMCVDGVCKAVHATGIITGLSANSGSVSCGGLICRPITGIFTRDPLPEDAYVHVATIPAGASNISITELGNSINLLVLRTPDQKYIFNGDNSASDSGAYEALGAIFNYHRIDGLQHGDGVTEWITCMGPIREMLELMIYSKSSNPGIKYEYLLPITSDSEENELSVESEGFLKNGPEESFASNSRSGRRRRFNWKVVGFSACSKTCGGGIQTPIVRCVRENPIRYYSQRRCMHSEKPMLNENLLRCNTQPCPAYWRIEDWSECHCQQGDGYRERDLSCVQELASGIVIHVDNSACMDEMPNQRKPCDCPKNRRRSHVARYRTAHSGANGTHNYRGRDKTDKSGIWLMSDWNQFCSAECGTGVEYRTISCDRSKPNTERCDSRATPEITRSCERSRDCEKGEWFAGPWTPCNGNCFNLTRTRPVYCIHQQQIVKDEDCKPELKPQIMENCSHEEVEYCGPRWHYSEWSECTKTCDGGTQRRSVKCLEYDEREGAMRESAKCRYSLREPIYRSCNTHNCDEPQLELLQNDVAVSCVDEFNNCLWAVKAKLCSYDYYKQNCCYSCGAA